MNIIEDQGYIELEKRYKNAPKDSRKDIVISFIDYIINKEFEINIDFGNNIEYDRKIEWIDKNNSFKISDFDNIIKIDDIDHINFSQKRIFLK